MRAGNRELRAHVALVDRVSVRVDRRLAQGSGFLAGNLRLVSGRPELEADTEPYRREGLAPEELNPPERLRLKRSSAHADVEAAAAPHVALPSRVETDLRQDRRGQPLRSNELKGGVSRRSTMFSRSWSRRP